MNSARISGTLAKATFLFSALFFSTPPAFAQTELRVAITAPAGTPWVAHLDAWKKNLETLSDGEMTLNIFLGGQLGTESDTFRQTQRGRIDIIAVSAGTLSQKIKEFSLMSTPFLFDDVDTIDCIYDGPFGEKLADLVQNDGFELLHWGETGWFGVFAMDDLSQADDVKGYKARVAFQDASQVFWSSLAADGIELPYIEISTALQTGMVKAGEATGISYIAFGFQELAPHFIATRHSHLAGAVLMGARSFNELSPGQQKTLIESAPEMNGYRASVRAANQGLIAKYAQNGGQVHELTAEERDDWRQRVEPNWPQFVTGLGETAEMLWPELLAAKAACEK